MTVVPPSRLHNLAVRRFTWLRKMADLQNCVETLNSQGDFEAGLDVMPRLLQIEALVNRLDQKVWEELERITYGNIGRDQAAGEGSAHGDLPPGSVSGEQRD